MHNRWQIISDDRVWMYPAERLLSTVEMPKDWLKDFGYKYESCLFTNHGSEILARYKTKKDALKGHRELEKSLSLKRGRKNG